MNNERPDCWLVYITNDEEVGLPELIAIAPEAMNRREMSIDARKVLAAVDAFLETHDHERVVFLAEVTAWLHHDKLFEWHDL